MRGLKRLLTECRGASSAEYALILAVCGAGIAIAAMTLGGNIASSMNVTSNTVATCGGSC